MIGIKVKCNFKGVSEWYNGTITSLARKKVGIVYDNGDKETTKTVPFRTK